jgi:plastocyanin
MKNLILALAAACAAALAAVAPALAADATVRIQQTGFTPLSTTIDRGDAVTWRNLDSVAHRVAAENGAFQSPLLAPGQTFTFEFNRSGTFVYSDPESTFQRGTVIVRPAEAEPSVTIQASATVVTYGGSVTLSGTVSSGEPGETVRVVGDAYRGSDVVRTVETNAEGIWRLAVRPQMRTVYRASWRGQESSTEPAVHVRSRVGFAVRNMAAGRFYTRAFAAYSFRGKLARLQRQTLEGDWITVRFVRLNTLSAATFVARLPRGATRVRMVVPASPGYLTGVSNVRVVRR